MNAKIVESRYKHFVSTMSAVDKHVLWNMNNTDIDKKYLTLFGENKLCF